MVERITDPHKPVQIHGTGRLPDGQGVKQPPAPPPAPPVTRRQYISGVVVAGIVLVLLVVGIAS